MITEKSWREFQQTGLLSFTNRFLHIFGWAIAYEVGDNKEITGVYPVRTRFRGFSEKDTSEDYVKLSQYMVENAKALLEEAKED